jgi:acyl-CoA synthetase (AMP-forming)/AMP-acid ligase II
VYTRDIGTFDEDGYLYILDRKDDMIISGGFNIWPAEVEDALYGHPAIKEAAAFGVADEKWGEAVVAAVCLNDTAHLSEPEIREYLRSRLARHKVPKRIWIRDETIPKSPVGKPLRRRVREQLESLDVAAEWGRTGSAS